jgi:putative membrane protein
MVLWVLLFHIIGLVFWIGGLLVATSLLGQHAVESFAEARMALGQAEMRMLNGMASPGALITLITGALLVAGRASFYLHAPWFQAKMVLVLCLLVLHGIAYIRARRQVSGRSHLPRRSWMVLHGAISLIFFGILICVLPGRLYWR